MIDEVNAPDLYVKDAGNDKGRGVFARRDFAEGELIEECPVVIFLRPFAELPPRLRDIVFNWGDLAKTTACTALSLGYGGLYNHANPASVYYHAVPENETMRYIAARAINKDEELTINYNMGGGGVESKKDNWFELRGMEVID